MNLVVFQLHSAKKKKKEVFGAVLVVHFLANQLPCFVSKANL